jgi:methylmalonyl-CoA mutase
MKDLLDENGCGHIKIFGGGGGTILPQEIDELQKYGIAKIYSPDDGRKMGLEGMIEDVIRQCSPLPTSPEGGGDWRHSEFWEAPKKWDNKLPLGEKKDIRKIARAITVAESGVKSEIDYNGFDVLRLNNDEIIYNSENVLKEIHSHLSKLPDKEIGEEKNEMLQKTPSTGGGLGEVPVLGITGTGGAGKSSVTDEIVRRYLNNFSDKTIAVISVDPSKKKTGGALLGDRIRMNSISHPRAYMRSLATRESDKALSKYVQEAIDICKAAAFDFISLESAGVGQSDASILDYCDVSLYV